MLLLMALQLLLVTKTFCPKMRHCRTALLLLKTSLHLILIHLSIPPPLFSGLCPMSEHIPLCPVHPPFHKYIEILSRMTYWERRTEQIMATDRYRAVRGTGLSDMSSLIYSKEAGLGLVFQVSGSSWKHHIVMIATVISRQSSVLLNAQIINQ